MTKVAIPVWNGRISPVLDVARRLWVAEIRDQAVVGEEELTLPEADLAEKVRLLRSIGVETLICGAVSGFLEAMLESAGIQVIPYRCGPTREVLAEFTAGRLEETRFAMPGCCGRRRRNRGCRRGRWDSL